MIQNNKKSEKFKRHKRMRPLRGGGSMKNINKIFFIYGLMFAIEIFIGSWGANSIKNISQNTQPQKYFEISNLEIKTIAKIFPVNVCFAQMPSANELLQASDRSRGAIKGALVWNATVETGGEEEASVREFRIQALGDDAYVEATHPPRNKGEIYLFNDRNMWFFKPNLKKPVSISPRQRLVGQAANGDIASTHYARDYSAEIEKKENLEGVGETFVLMLTAKEKNMTYDKIRYWISEQTKLAVKAEFLTLQGVAFKIGRMKYENQLLVDGKNIPFISELIIQDAKNTQNKSIIKYKDIKTTELNKKIFNINNLTR